MATEAAVGIELPKPAQPCAPVPTPAALVLQPRRAVQVQVLKVARAELLSLKTGRVRLQCGMGTWRSKYGRCTSLNANHVAAVDGPGA